MRAALITCAGLAFACNNAAAATWSYTEVVGPTGQSTTHVAVASDQYHGVGVRCQNSVYSIQFLTNEHMVSGRSSTAQLSIGGGSYSFQIDGMLQDTANGMMFVALAQPELIEALLSTRDTIVLAIKRDGTITHQKSFSSSGLNVALNSLREACEAS